MTSGQGGHDQPGWQTPPQQGWQAPPPQQGWQAPPPQQNPGYAPAPSAPGPVRSPEPERPTSVRVGIGAFLATLVLGVISSLVSLTEFDDLVADVVSASTDPNVTEDIARVGLIVGVVVGLLLTALQALFIWFAWKGRNWARIVLLVLGGIAVLSGLLSLGGVGTVPMSGFLASLSVFSLLLTTVGIVALAVKPSNDWYAAMRERRAAGLR